MELRVWWLSQEDCKLLSDDIVKGLPEYIVDEVRSLERRNGRCRLWVAPMFGEVGCNWSDNSTVCRTLEQLSSGGIVVRADDVGVLPQHIGILTDLNVGIVENGRV